jgi:hypothetical protein
MKDKNKRGKPIRQKEPFIVIGKTAYYINKKEWEALKKSIYGK